MSALGLKRTRAPAKLAAGAKHGEAEAQRVQRLKDEAEKAEKAKQAAEEEEAPADTATTP